VFTSVRNLLIFLVGGAAITVFGLYSLLSSEVTCGSEAMNPGDVCTTSSKRGGEVDRTYEEQARHDTLMGVGAVILGPLMLVGGTWMEVSKIRKRKAAESGAPAPAPAQQPVPQHHAQQQGAWQQPYPQAPYPQQPYPQYPQQGAPAQWHGQQGAPGQWQGPPPAHPQQPYPQAPYPPQHR